MLIRLTSSIFRKDPDKRFSDRYNVPQGALNYLCSFRFIDWPLREVAEQFNMVYAKNITEDSLGRWKQRREIYLRGQHLLHKKKYEVQVQEFGQCADFILHELNLK